MIEVEEYKKGRYWIAISRQFKTFGSSKISKVDAMQDFQRAISLFFLIHSERKTIPNLIKTHDKTII